MLALRARRRRSCDTKVRLLGSQAPSGTPAPAPGEAPESPELKLSRLEVEIVPGVLPGAGVPGAGGLSDGDWAMIVRRLKLSTRESEIIRGLVTEQKDQAIAHELGISYNTLRKQLSRLYRKLGVQTRVGVVVRAYEALIELRQTPAENTQRQERQQPEEERS